MTLVHDATVAEWPVWSTTARVVVTDPAALAEARFVVECELDEVERACSRFRPSELAAVEAAGEEVEVSELLAELMGAALEAARRTGGDVDPTLGEALAQLGYDRSLPLPAEGPAVPVRVRPARLATDPVGETAVVHPAGCPRRPGRDREGAGRRPAARHAAGRLGTGVLVELGGDLATAGAAPPGGWRVHVQDQPDDPACTVVLPSGAAMATSSTRSRSWLRGGRLLHHVLDPRTCQPVERIWRSATVVADRCVDANTCTTAALVRADDAGRPAGMSTDALWDFGRGSGVVALVLVTVSVVLGILTRRGEPVAGLPRFAVTEVHRNASLLSVVFLALHVGLLLFDPCAQLRIFDLVVPFGGDYRPFWQGLGTVALDLLVALVVTSLLRQRAGQADVARGALAGLRDVAGRCGALAGHRHRRVQRVVPRGRRRVRGRGARRGGVAVHTEGTVS